MYSRHVVAVVMVALAGSVGCKSLRLKADPARSTSAASPVAKPPTEPTLAAEIEKIERAAADAQRNQEKINKDLQAVRQDMFEAAKGLRALKDRTDLVVGESETNRLALEELNKRLQQEKARFENNMAGLPREAASLRLALEQERQQRSRDLALAEEQEKEMQRLRKAASAAQPGAAAPAAPAAIPASTPPPAAPAKPAAAASAAPTNSVYRMIAEGNMSLKQSDLARATGYFKAALDQDPTLLGARVGLAACAYQSDDLKEASRLIESVLRDDPRNAQALGLRGIIAWKQGLTGDALDDCAQAVDSDPNDSMLHKFYGIVLHARGRQDDAIREMRKAIELDPTDSEAKVNLAILLATSRRPALDEARLVYEQALSAGVERDSALDKILYGSSSKP